MFSDDKYCFAPLFSYVSKDSERIDLRCILRAHFSYWRTLYVWRQLYLEPFRVANVFCYFGAAVRPTLKFTLEEFKDHFMI